MDVQGEGSCLIPRCPERGEVEPLQDVRTGGGGGIFNFLRGGVWIFSGMTHCMGLYLQQS